jgi:enediyne biosynthesis protein E4
MTSAIIRKRITRRQRLLAVTSISSLCVLAVASAAVFVRRAPRPYTPAEQVEGITDELGRRLPPDYPRVTFTEVSAQAGINFQHFSGSRSTQLPEDMGSGAAWGDYNNDGNEDLFVVNISGPLTLSAKERQQSPASCRLYRNNGNGTFTDVTEKAGLPLRICGMGAAWGDFDGDGWLDLVVTSYPDLYLFHNNHDGTFTDVTKAAGLSRFKGFWTGVSWNDFDRDGHLDLYVCGYTQYHFNPADRHRTSLQFQGEVPYTLNPSSYRPERNLLLRNNGDGTFTDVAKQAGVDDSSGRSLSAAWCDFDGRGWDDLYVANDVSNSAMFRNLGNGKFTDISDSACVGEYRGSMGLAIGDWDNDGDFDIFVTHWIAQQDALFTNMRIPSRGAKPGRLFFSDTTDQYGLGQITLDYIGFGTFFFDYDNDGRQDLFVANGSTFQDEKDKRKLVPMHHLLFWNKSNLDGFFEVSGVSGEIFKQQTVGRGAAFADYDNDGDVDVFVVNHGARGWLLRNEGGNRNRWLEVKVRGKHNRFGVGAKVKVTTGSETQMQEIGSQTSYLSQNSLTAHFGVGKAETVDQVVVAFPSGKIVRQQGVKSNQILTIREP